MVGLRVEMPGLGKGTYLGVILRAEPGRPYEQTAYMLSFPLPWSPVLAVSFQSSR